MCDREVVGSLTDVVFYFDHLEQIAKSVNLGGSILNVVDSAQSPVMEVDVTYSAAGGTSLTRNKTSSRLSRYLPKPMKSSVLWCVAITGISGGPAADGYPLYIPIASSIPGEPNAPGFRNSSIK